ncbi:hypothetical protein [Arthrobacter sp. 2YAF22_2]|uniref:hypothetical protein n=1 Tax=Arthrobacter sp. 2YAF22_2 TaxID=3233029 RepID=UPI003F920CFA
MNSTRTAENPSPEDRKGKKPLLIGLVLAVILIGGGIWASPLVAPSARTGAEDATQAGAAPSSATQAPPQTAASQTNGVAPGTAATPAPSSTGESAAAAPTATGAKVKSEAELAATPQLVSAPVAITDPAALRPGVTADITKFESVTGTAAGPGEIAGPAIRFTVSVHNQSAKSVSLEGALINVEYGPNRTPALQLSGPGAARFPESVGAGATASAVFVFLLPMDQRGQVYIYLNYEVSSPIAAFAGSITTSEGKS